MAPLVEAFLAALPAGEGPAAGDRELEAVLAAAVARGVAAHPAIDVAGAAVVAHLGAHADDHRAPVTWIPQRNLPDVHLVCGLVAGAPAATAVFEQRHTPEMLRAAGRLLDPEGAADVVAAVREKLLVGVDARGPRISDYGGHGELGVWVRVITIRAALSELRRTRRLVPAEDHLWEAASPSADPALTVLKQESAALIKAAFHEGLATLAPRQRNLLRQHLLDGLTIDELGVIYRIHRVTAARWLSAARADLWAHTRRRLRQSLGLSDSAIGGMLEEIRSTLDLSIERVLAP